MKYLTLLRETHSNPKGIPYEILHTIKGNVFEKVKKLSKQRVRGQPLQAPPSFSVLEGPFPAPLLFKFFKFASNRFPYGIVTFLKETNWKLILKT